MKYFEYHGEVITASSKQEAIQKIIASESSENNFEKEWEELEKVRDPKLKRVLDNLYKKVPKGIKKEILSKKKDRYPDCILNVTCDFKDSKKLKSIAEDKFDVDYYYYKSKSLVKICWWVYVDKEEEEKGNYEAYINLNQSLNLLNSVKTLFSNKQMKLELRIPK